MTNVTSKSGSVTNIRLRRCGSTSYEVLVAFTLLTTLLSLSLSSMVRHGRLLTSEQNYCLALDELSNQLDRLTALPGNELSEAVKELQLTPFTAERLSDAKLVGEIATSDIGQRVTLRLTSRDPNGLKVSMAGWMFPARSLSGGRAK
jgi:hypothetical protein